MTVDVLATAVLAFLAVMGSWFGYLLLRLDRQEAIRGYGRTRDDASQQL